MHFCTFPFIDLADDGRHNQIVGIKGGAVQSVQCNGTIGIDEVSAEIEIESQLEGVKSHQDEKDRVIGSKDKEIDRPAEHEESVPTVRYVIKSAKMFQHVNAAEADHGTGMSAKKIVNRLNEEFQQIKMLSDDH